MAQRWKFKCYRSDNFNIKTARICDKHFVPTDYVRNLKHELLGYSPKSCRKLKDDAVPSVNLPTGESIPPSTSRQARFDVKLRKTIVKNLLAQVPDENIDPNLPDKNVIIDAEPECQNTVSTKELSLLELELQNLKKENGQLLELNKNLEIKTGKNYIANLIDISEQVDLTKNVKILFFKCKMYFRMRKLNKIISENSLNKNKKLKKIIT